MQKKILPIKYIISLLIVVLILALSNTYVFAFGIDLKNIIINNDNEKTTINFELSDLPKQYHLDRSKKNQIKLSLPETYLSTDLIKNLDIILNDNIKWKQYSDKLDVTIKHRCLTELAKIYKSKNSTTLVVIIPKYKDYYDKLISSSTNIKPLPPKRRSRSASRSFSKFRNELPAYVLRHRHNPNNQMGYRQIIPGVTHMRIKRNTKNGPLLINIIDVAPNIPNYEVIPALANQRIFGKKTIRTIVRQNKGIAGINAGFFKPPTGVPLGTMIIDEELISGPIFDRVTLGITKDNEYRIERIHLTGQLVTEDGNVLTLDNVNQPRLSKDHYLLYSYRWGWKTEKGPPGSKQVLLINGKIKSVSADAMAIPRNGYVIVGPDKDLFSSFRVGDKVKLIVSTDPDWSDVKHAVGGGPFLVKNKQVYVDKDAQKFSLKNIRAPRTAVGVTKDDHLLLVTVDGRQKEKSVGVTFYELAYIMIELGAVNAMNLDGGSSTQMCIGEDITNSPTVSGGNNVSNGLIIAPRKESSIVGY